MWQVQENGKPADYHHFPVDNSWNQSSYDSLDDAINYMHNWLGDYGAYYINDRYRCYIRPFCYNGYDVIQCVEIPDAS